MEPQFYTMKISSIDHLVLTVKDRDETVRFYTSVLGMGVETFGEGRLALTFGSQKINLHEEGKEFEPKACRPTPGSADLCLITSLEIHRAMAFVQQQGAQIIEGPVQRKGQRAGLFRSISETLMVTL